SPGVRGLANDSEDDTSRSNGVSHGSNERRIRRGGIKRPFGLEDCYVGPADEDFMAQFCYVTKLSPSEDGRLTRREVGAFIKLMNKVNGEEEHDSDQDSW